MPSCKSTKDQLLQVAEIFNWRRFSSQEEENHFSSSEYHYLHVQTSPT
ncbi:unnamed protein product [Musa hybrid cultivar]